MPAAVSDFRANRNENIEHAAQAIGRSAHRRAVFEAIYRGRKAVKTVAELAKATTLSQKQVLIAGKQLVGNQIVEQTSVGGRVAYQKDEAIAHYKNKILDLVDHPEKKDRYPTKQEPRVKAPPVTYRVTIARSNPRPQEITIDDIDAFAAVKEIDHGAADLSKTLESDVKKFLNRVIGEANEFKDWGGENNDIFTTRLRFRGSRRAAAVAIKGRATKGTLNPGKMGTNGDQVARLFASPATMFFVVYHGKVADSIHEQMRVFGLGRAAGGERVYYCVIDGNDLARLVAAYPDEFEGVVGA